MLGDCVKWIVWGFNFIATEWARKKGWRDEIPNFIARYLGKKKSFLLFLVIDTISLNSYLL